MRSSLDRSRLIPERAGEEGRALSLLEGVY